MRKILVLANETIAGEKLLDAILARKGEDVTFHVDARCDKTSTRHQHQVCDLGG